MKKILIPTIIVFVAIVVAGLIVNSKKEKLPPVDTGTVLQVNEVDHVSGDPYSPVVLVEYLDFQCPACGAYHPLIEAVKEANKDKIAVVTRHFPLGFHQNARAAAYAVEAAANQNKFDQMVDLVFANQQAWSSLPAPSATFESYAQELGLDMEKYTSDRDSDEVRARIQKDIDGATAIGVNSTPSFYLQGEKLSNLRTVEDFQTLIDAELVKVAN